MSIISKRFKLIKRRLGRTLIGRNPFDMAYFFCKGSGVEIGARNNPYPFGNGCKVAYADIADEVEIENISHSILAKIQENEENITIEFAHKAYLKELEIRAKLEIARMNNETKKQIAKLKKQK